MIKMADLCEGLLSISRKKHKKSDAKVSKYSQSRTHIWYMDREMLDINS